MDEISNIQEPSAKQVPKIKSQVPKRPYDLTERTYLFARRCRDFVKKLPKSQANIEYGKQLIRSSGSTSANYIEANEALGKKDFYHRIRISRKEVKESRLWLRLAETNNNKELIQEQRELILEAIELTKIFSSMAN